MTIFSVGIVALGSIVPLLKSDVTRSDQRTRAVYLAQETVEWLHGLPYDDPLLAEGTHADETYTEPGYTRSWRVESDVVMAGVKQVRVSVNRDGQPGESASILFFHAEVGR